LADCLLRTGDRDHPARLVIAIGDFHTAESPDSLICQRYSATSAAAATWGGWRGISHEGGRWIWALTTDRNLTAERPEAIIAWNSRGRC
jgi:hypothetical protein